MELDALIQSVNQINGQVLIVGVNDVTISKNLVNCLKGNKKRNLRLVEKFSQGEGKWQNAHDVVNQAKNLLKVEASYYDFNFSDRFTSPPFKDKFGIVLINSLSHTYDALTFALPLTYKFGIILINNFNLPKVQAKTSRYLEQNNLVSKVSTSGDFSYIKLTDSFDRITYKTVERSKSIMT